MFPALRQAREAHERGVSYLPKGLNTIRGAIAQAVAKHRQIDAQEYAASRWEPKSPAVAKAALPGLTTTTGTGAQMSTLPSAMSSFSTSFALPALSAACQV